MNAWARAASAVFIWVLASCDSSKPPKLDDYGELPSFSLVDQSERSLTRADLDGRVTILNFIFTRCPTVCPTVSMKMKRIQDKTASLGTALQILSISVDPEFDTPDRLRVFGKKFGADPDRWKFLTGDRALIEESLVAAVKLAVERRGELPGGGPDIVHGTHFVLIDGKHRIRGYYNSDDQGRLDTLVHDATWLAKRVSSDR